MTSKKLYELDWVLNNGNLYARTAVEVMLTSPEKRASVVEKWLENAIKEDDACWKHECEMHALVALLAMDQMGNKVASDFCGFFNEEKFWGDWMKEQIEG